MILCEIDWVAIAAFCAVGVTIWSSYRGFKHLHAVEDRKRKEAWCDKVIETSASALDYMTSPILTGVNLNADQQKRAIEAERDISKLFILLPAGKRTESIVNIIRKSILVSNDPEKKWAEGETPDNFILLIRKTIQDVREGRIKEFHDAKNK